MAAQKKVQKPLDSTVTPKRIPIKAAKDLAQNYGQDQVIVMAWDDSRKLMHVVSYGKTMKDCEQAAQGANLMKKVLGFPYEMTVTKPARVVRKAKRGKKTPVKAAPVPTPPVSEAVVSPVVPVETPANAS